MKLVVAIVRPEKLAGTLKHLFAANIKGLSVSRVQGHGGELTPVQTYRGARVRMNLQDKMRIEIAVSDDFVDPAINAIMEAAATGEVGDGKVFVMPVDRVIRIRSGEVDARAVTPEPVTQPA